MDKNKARCIAGVALLSVCAVGVYCAVRNGARVPAPVPADGAAQTDEADSASPTRPIEKKFLDSSLTPEMLVSMARANEETVRALMALTATSAVRRAAVSALGKVRHPAVRADAAHMLLSLTKDADAGVASEAAKALAETGREHVVADLVGVIRCLYSGGPHGHGLTVCEAAATGLGRIRSRSALDALLAQLARANESDWVHDYGSAVVAALRDWDRNSRQGLRSVAGDEPFAVLRGPYSAEIRAALREYAKRLETLRRTVPNEAAREYLGQKIEEALAGTEAEEPGGAQ